MCVCVWYSDNEPAYKQNKAAVWSKAWATVSLKRHYFALIPDHLHYQRLLLIMSVFKFKNRSRKCLKIKETLKILRCVKLVCVAAAATVVCSPSTSFGISVISVPVTRSNKLFLHTLYISHHNWVTSFVSVHCLWISGCQTSPHMWTPLIKCTTCEAWVVIWAIDSRTIKVNFLKHFISTSAFIKTQLKTSSNVHRHKV